MTQAVPVQHLKKTPITEMLNLNESIRKEKAHLKIYQDFTVNPAKLMVYPEKPNLLKPLSTASLHSSSAATGFSVDLDDETKSRLTRFTFTPKQKYSYPQTASQELGWYTNNGEFDSKRKAKKSCNETKYANDYFAMTNLSPYSKKNK